MLFSLENLVKRPFKCRTLNSIVMPQTLSSLCDCQPGRTKIFPVSFLGHVKSVTQQHPSFITCLEQSSCLCGAAQPFLVTSALQSLTSCRLLHRARTWLFHKSVGKTELDLVHFSKEIQVLNCPFAHCTLSVCCCWAALWVAPGAPKSRTWAGAHRYLPSLCLLQRFVLSRV